MNEKDRVLLTQLQSICTEKSFQNLIKSNRNQTVFTIFRLIWNSKTNTIGLLLQINLCMVNTVWFRFDFCVCDRCSLLRESSLSIGQCALVHIKWESEFPSLWNAYTHQKYTRPRASRTLTGSIRVEKVPETPPKYHYNFVLRGSRGP